MDLIPGILLLLVCLFMGQILQVLGYVTGIIIGLLPVLIPVGLIAAFILALT